MIIPEYGFLLIIPEYSIFHVQISCIVKNYLSNAVNIQACVDQSNSDVLVYICPYRFDTQGGEISGAITVAFIHMNSLMMYKTIAVVFLYKIDC